LHKIAGDLRDLYGIEVSLHRISTVINAVLVKIAIWKMIALSMKP